MANPALPGGGSVLTLLLSAVASTVGAAATALAKVASCVSRPSSIGMKAAASSGVRRLTACSGEVWSGSAKMTSKAIAAAPWAVSFSTSSAMIVRDHGHWPIRDSDSSSMSTTRTGTFGS